MVRFNLLKYIFIQVHLLSLLPLSCLPVDVGDKADDKDQHQYADSNNDKCRVTNYTMRKQQLFQCELNRLITACVARVFARPVMSKPIVKAKATKPTPES